MEISDTYTTAGTKLSQLTSGLQQQKQLQNEVFAAAERSRGNYSDMADTVAKLGTTSGEQFGNTNNLVKFTETMQKMFKVSGMSAQDQAGAWSQLQQSIGSGKLQGQDFGTLTAGAPLVEQAIAQYMGKSADDIKSLGAAGEITSQALINSVLAYSQTADQKMSSMPMTFSDCWNTIKTGAMEAFGSVFESMSGILNSQGIQAVINGVIGGLAALAQAANGVLSAVAAVGQFFADNWTVILPAILGATVALAAFAVQSEIARIKTGKGIIAAAIKAGADFNAAVALFTETAAQQGLNAAIAACPISWIIMGVVLLVAAFYAVVAVINKITGQSTSATGLIVGAVFVIGAAVKNAGMAIANIVLGINDAFWACISNIKTFFNNAWIDIQSNFLDFVDTILGGVKSIIDWLNRIPGVEIDSSGIEDKILANEDKKAHLYAQKQDYKDVGAEFTRGASTFDAFQEGWASNARNKGYDIGSSWADSALDTLKNLSGGANQSDAFTDLEDNGPSNSPAGTANDPTTVQGTGSGGTLSVDISDQDLQYLRDLAEKDYIAKFSTATLAPNISVSVNNSTAEDLNGLKNRIATILREGIATAAEGSYA
ncbi:MAG: tape measure protein [Intestinimonas sp.]|nr:tape measure protein [Intestinimonas sp.]